jgi:nucleoside-diphosphate-sugar epimerase
MITLPSSIADVDQLEDLLSTPTEGVVETLSRLEGDMVVLGVGGKMGPTLARMVRRAWDVSGHRGRVFGVSRFSDRDLPERLKTHGIEPIAADLLGPAQVAGLPDAANVIAMTGQKFGTARGQAALTWAVNVMTPVLMGHRYRASKIVAFSTGNVYPFVPTSGTGSRETDSLGPVGEYAMTALGRERFYEHLSAVHQTSVALIRLNYASEPRYGVLVDTALKVLAGEPIDLTMGHVNTIWQGDANALALRAFDHVESPPEVFNLTGPDVLSVRVLAEEFGRHFGKAPTFQRTEAPDALLSDASKAFAMLGRPQVEVGQMIAWVADWLTRGQPVLDKPTKFDVRDGRF